MVLLYVQIPLWVELVAVAVFERASRRSSSICYRSYPDPCNRYVPVPSSASSSAPPGPSAARSWPRQGSVEPEHRQYPPATRISFSPDYLRQQEIQNNIPTTHDNKVSHKDRVRLLRAVTSLPCGLSQEQVTSTYKRYLFIWSTFYKGVTCVSAHIDKSGKRNTLEKANEIT